MGAMLTKILEYLVKSLEDGNILIALVMVIIALIFKAKAIYEFYTTLKIQKEKLIFKDIKNKNISNDVKEFLIEQVNTLAFQRATGIYAENPLRNMKIADGKLTVNQVLKHKIDFIITNLFAIIMLCYGIMILIIPVIAKNKTLSAILGVYALAVFFILIAAAMFRSSMPHRYAKKIKSLLEGKTNISPT